MLPTVAQVLAMDAVRGGEPRVVAGSDSLDRLVRWVQPGGPGGAGGAPRGGGAGSADGGSA